MIGKTHHSSSLHTGEWCVFLCISESCVPANTRYRYSYNVAQGIVTAQKDGNVTITATANGITVSCVVTPELDKVYGQNSTQTVFGVSYLVKNVDELNAVAKIQPGEWSTGSQAGQNCADVVGYSFDGCIFYILSENYDTISTTYYSSRHLAKTPVEYKN